MNTKPAIAEAREKITREFRFKDYDLRWYDFTGVASLTKGIIFKLEIRGVSPLRYNHIRVQIVSKTAGLLDEKDFAFSDYLVTSTEGRQDASLFIAQDGSTIDWYALRPTDLNLIMEPIELYLLTWARA